MASKLNSEFNYRYQVIGDTPWERIKTLKGFLEGRIRAAALNLSSTIWKNLLLYIDMGLLKTSLDDSFRFVYDTGIRLNIIADYFEIYFPIKSSNGFEIKDPNYNEKIRFLFTFEPDVLLGLFRRKWY